MVAKRVQQIEEYVRRSMDGTSGLKIAHDFKHVDRVRNWALHIGRGEGFEDQELLEATALLHDIGLASVEDRSQHAPVGAEIAARFLGERGLFSEAEIDAIADAIRCHSSPSGGGILGVILRDADRLDALGAVGLMRAFTSKYDKPEYDPWDVKSSTWGMKLPAYEEQFAAGKGIGETIVDQINFQIGVCGHFCTETAKKIGKPLIRYMQAFVLQLESEINAARNEK